MLLREYLRTRRSLPLGEAVGLIGPLCSELAQRFAAGERCYVHPSCISLEGSALTLTAPNQAPQAPEDVACHPPELSQTAGPMDARGAVYAVGAILYELVTGLSFGRGLGVQPPRALVPSLPEAFDTLLAVALRANPAERPAELQALASALSGIANTGSMHPADGIDVAFSMAPPTLDVTFSLPPTAGLGPQPGIPQGVAPVAAPSGMSMPHGGTPRIAAAVPMAANSAPGSARAMLDPFAVAEAPRSAATLGGGALNGPVSSQHSAQGQAHILGQLKTRLESDSSPRYVIVKDGMDHGPFSAVELLQQVASHTFIASDVLRDATTGESKALGEWPDFAPFAEHAKLNREVVAEKKAVVQLEKQEKKSGVLKFVLGGVVATLLLSAGGAYIYKSRGERAEGRDISADKSAVDLAVGGGLRGGKKPAGNGGGAGGGGAAGGGGGGAYARGGMSYEAALASNTEEVKMGGGGGPDLNNGQLAGPMQNASFISGCGAPNNMKVTVRVAIKMGNPVGVSVYTNPSDGAVASCVDRHVRGIRWPANAKMDSFTTTY